MREGGAAVVLEQAKLLAALSKLYGQLPQLQRSVQKRIAHTLVCEQASIAPRGVAQNDLIQINGGGSETPDTGIERIG